MICCDSCERWVHVACDKSLKVRKPASDHGGLRSPSYKRNPRQTNPLVSTPRASSTNANTSDAGTASGARVLFSESTADPGASSAAAAAASSSVAGTVSSDMDSAVHVTPTTTTGRSLRSSNTDGGTGATASESAAAPSRLNSDPGTRTHTQWRQIRWHCLWSPSQRLRLRGITM